MDFKEAIKGRLLRLPVLVKVMGIALGFAVFLCAAQVWQIQHSYFPLEQREVEEDASFLARSLAAGATPIVRNGTTAELQQLLDEGARVSPTPFTTIQQVVVADKNGQVLARTSHPPEQGAGGRVVERSAPLTSAQGGTLSVTLNDRHVNYEVGWHKRRIALTTAIATLLGLLAAWWLIGLVTRPLAELGDTVREVKAGNYRARAPVRAKDEFGQLAAAFNDMTAALQAKDAMNRQLVKRLLVVGEEERKRIAQELNEQTGQALSSLATRLADTEAVATAERLPELRALASQAVREVHDLSLALRPTALDDLGLAAALQTLCDGLAQRLGVTVECAVFALDSPVRLPAEVEVSLFRIAEEAITAAVRQHRASSVELVVQRKAASVLAIIEYDSAGSDAGDGKAQSPGQDDLDLLSIEERARLLNGSLHVESRPGAGTSLIIEIPVTGVGQPEAATRGQPTSQPGR